MKAAFLGTGIVAVLICGVLYVIYGDAQYGPLQYFTFALAASLITLPLWITD